MSVIPFVSLCVHRALIISFPIAVQEILLTTFSQTYAPRFCFTPASPIFLLFPSMPPPHPPLPFLYIFFIAFATVRLAVHYAPSNGLTTPPPPTPESASWL